MAKLHQESGERSCVLLPEHLIGRGPQCALRLTDKNYVSSQHAVVRWSGNGWEAIDRGSRNGTRLDGARMEPGRAYRLTQGSILSFGHPQERWALADASEPQVMALALGSGEPRFPHCGMIGIPSAENPACTIFQDADGLWKLEEGDGALSTLHDGQRIEAGGHSYLFSYPTSSDMTAGVETAAGSAPTLRFVVSSDEDFVELTLEYEERTVSLGSRGHNYLLLTLARQKLLDRANNVPIPSSGWVDKDQLAQGLRITPQLIDGEIFRIRKHFASHGIAEATSIIERRARTRQIRLGPDNVSVERR
ncbi:MAG: FHA domain-containing protein [Pseudomonadota bacterium]